MPSYGSAGRWRGLAQGAQGLGALIMQTALAQREKRAQEEERAFRERSFNENVRQFDVGRADAREGRDIDLQTRGFEITQAGQMTPGQQIARAALPGIAGIAANGAGLARDGGDPIKDASGRQITYNQARDPQQLAWRSQYDTTRADRTREREEDRRWQVEDREDAQRHAAGIVATQMRGAGGAGGLSVSDALRLQGDANERAGAAAAAIAVNNAARGGRTNVLNSEELRGVVRQFPGADPAVVARTAQEAAVEYLRSRSGITNQSSLREQRESRGENRARDRARARVGQ